MIVVIDADMVSFMPNDALIHTLPRRHLHAASLAIYKNPKSVGLVSSKCTAIWAGHGKLGGCVSGCTLCSISKKRRTLVDGFSAGTLAGTLTGREGVSEGRGGGEGAEGGDGGEAGGGGDGDGGEGAGGGCVVRGREWEEGRRKGG